MGLADVIAAAGSGTQLRHGLVSDIDVGVISVDIGGGTLIQAAYLASYMPVLHDTVSILGSNGTWLVLGSCGTSGLGVAAVATAETCSSATYGDLATIGPTLAVVLGAAGRVRVDMTARISGASATLTASMGVDVAGPTPAAAADTAALMATMATGGTFSATRTKFISGLTPGTYTFTAKYRASTGTVNFADREMFVSPY